MRREKHMMSPIDTFKLKQLIGDQDALINSMLLLFANDLTEHISQLQALNGEPDTWPTYQKLLHRLIGSASYFGTDDLRTVLLHAEALSREHDGEALNAMLEQVYREAARVLACDLMQKAMTDPTS